MESNTGCLLGLIEMDQLLIGWVNGWMEVCHLDNLNL